MELLLLLLLTYCFLSFHVSGGAAEYWSYCLIILGSLLSGFEHELAAVYLYISHYSVSESHISFL